MYNFSNPYLVYSDPPLKKGEHIVPLVVFKESSQAYDPMLNKLEVNPKAIVREPDFHVVWWIDQESTRFVIRTVVICDRKATYHGFDLVQGTYGGKSVFYYGDLEALKKMLPADHGFRDPTAPAPHKTEKMVDLIAVSDKDFNKAAQEITNVFSETLIDQFGYGKACLKTHDVERFNKLCKGLTFGRSTNIYGFLMQCIKQSYSSIGFYKKTYSGFRVSNFDFNDLLGYVKDHSTAFDAKHKASSGLVIVPDMQMTKSKIMPPENRTLTPKNGTPADLVFTADKRPQIPPLYLEEIKRAMAYWQHSGKARPMDGSVKNPKLALEPRVVDAYGFRADGRSPLVVFYAGGMHPSTIRDNFRKVDNPVWKNYMDQPHFDPWLHQANDFYPVSIFLSVSYATSVAKKFISINCNGNGFIYVIRAVGAVDQVGTFNETIYDEREISVPGGCDWTDIIAFRQVINEACSDHCYVNLNNPWRAKEKALQDEAIRRLLLQE